MQATGRESSADVVGQLLARPQAFEFLQAARLLAIRHTLLGQDGPSARFRAAASLGYPATQTADAEVPSLDNPADRPTLAVNFIGLHGPTGPLPAHVTQDVAAAEGASRLGDVLDFLNHHLVRQFFALHRTTRADLAIEAHRLDDAFANRQTADPVTRQMVALAGSRIPSQTARRSVRQEQSVLAYFAAHWRRRPIGLTALQSMLRRLTGLPVTVVPFEPIWSDLEFTSRLHLGDPNRRRRHDIALGRGGCAIGRRALRRNWGVLIRFGPLDLPAYRRLLPGRRSLRRIAKLCRVALGQTADYVIQPVLKANQVPQWRLGESKEQDGTQVIITPTLTLGRSLWLGRYRVDDDFAGLKLPSSRQGVEPAAAES